MPHWTEKAEAKRLVAHELAERGWRLFGYSPDRSDAMTDYYAPASWDGVATKEGTDAVLCVDVSSYHTSRAGELPKVHGTRKVEDCDRCHGAELDPEGWTLSKARQDPRGWHDAVEVTRRALGDHAISLMRDVVSPVTFREGGLERCRKCGGSGGRFEATVTDGPESERWPVFQANPGRCTWHVERAGRIVAKGTGLYSVVTGTSSYSDERKAAVRAFVDRLEAAALPHNPAARSEGKTVVLGSGVTIEPGKREGYVDVRFPAKPPAETIAAMKRAGFRWAPSFGCWYGPAGNLPEGVAR